MAPGRAQVKARQLAREMENFWFWGRIIIDYNGDEDNGNGDDDSNIHRWQQKLQLVY